VRITPALLAVALLCGCATTKELITGPVPPVRLPAAQERTTTGIHHARWQIPAGEYVAEFRDRAGTYYKPPAPIIVNGAPSPGVYLFIGQDGTQAVYTNGAAVRLKFQPPLPLSVVGR
jgi:hypothetical protein